MVAGLYIQLIKVRIEPVLRTSKCSMIRVEGTYLGCRVSADMQICRHQIRDVGTRQCLRIRDSFY
jgi:hypothetical protein